MSPPDDLRRALEQAADDACVHLGRRTVGAFVDPCAANLAVKIVRLTFVSDHGLLTDYDPPYDDLDRWKTGGTPYAQKVSHEWAEDHSFPITQTKNTPLAVIPEFEIAPPQAGPVEGEIQAHAVTEVLGLGPRPEWEFNGTATLGRGATSPILFARAPLPDKVTQHVRSLAWKVTIRGVTYHAGHTGLHRVYATQGTPVPGGEPQPTPYGPDPPVDEEGITEHRTRAAVVLTEQQLARLATPATRNDPHTIVRALMTIVPEYTLKRSPRVPREFDHPRYYPETSDLPLRGGAWPIADYYDDRAECQAICRFVRGILMQIGCPGEADVVAVYAHEKVNRGRTALEDSIVPEDPRKHEQFKGGRHMPKPGLNHSEGPDMPPNRGLCLADKKVSVGELVPFGETLNAYEACLKFTHGGVTRYYGGGMPDTAFDSPQGVLKAAFWGLVLVTYLEGWRQIERIVATREDW